MGFLKKGEEGRAKNCPELIRNIHLKFRKHKVFQTRRNLQNNKTEELQSKEKKTGGKNSQIFYIEMTITLSLEVTKETSQTTVV